MGKESCGKTLLFPYTQTYYLPKISLGVYKSLATAKRTSDLSSQMQKNQVIKYLLLNSSLSIAFLQSKKDVTHFMLKHSCLRHYRSYYMCFILTEKFISKGSASTYAFDKNFSFVFVS